MGRTGATLLAVLGAGSLVVGCDSPRQQLEEFPPISCTFEDAEGDHHRITVRVDDEPAHVLAGDLTFRAHYRSANEGRVLEISTSRDRDDAIERVTYLVPGRTTLRNQFGDEGEALTGEHRVTLAEDEVIWSCAVMRTD